MGKKTVQDMAKQRTERFKRREELTNEFLMQFTITVLFCVIIWVHMSLWGRADVLARNLRVYLPWVMLALGVCFFGFRQAKRANFDKWVSFRQKVWNYFAYSFASLALLYGIINLHISFNIEKWAHVPLLHLGNEMWAFRWGYAWIGVGLIICLVRYLIKYNRVGK